MTRTVSDVERELILCVINRTNGNRSHTAREVGLSVNTVKYKIARYKHKGFKVPAPGERNDEHRCIFCDQAGQAH